MGRIAYIISAYKDAQHLSRLVDALDYDADFYVHVDLKVDIRPFEEALGDKVTFVPRHWTSWGGWSQVEYQKEMIGAVLQSGKPYSRVVCLSGQDYPLWSNEQIHSFFDERPRQEIISGVNVTQGGIKKQLRKVRVYHFFRDLPWRWLWMKYKFIVASRWAMRLLPIKKKPYTTIEGKRADVYTGSDYWGITLSCARHVYETLCKETKLVSYFKTAFVPSELCVQTIVFNSPFGKYAIFYEDPRTGLGTLTPLHYIDYGKCIKVFTLKDLATLMGGVKCSLGKQSRAFQTNLWM